MERKSPKKESHKIAGENNTSFTALKGWLTEARQYFIALPLAIGAFLAFTNYVADVLHWPKWTAFLAFVPLLLVFLFKTVPRLIEWRHQRVFIKSAERDAAKPMPRASAASYFLIGPYGEERRSNFARADNVHVKVLDWLRRTDERIVILTGSSGTGKSSLLSAFVIPTLRESVPHCEVLLLRSFDNPFTDLRSQLLKPGIIWEKPPAEKVSLPLIELIQHAVIRLRRGDMSARLFVVFDQFEEFVVLHTERSPLVDDMKAFLRELQRTSLDGFVVLLSIRLDYRMFLEPLGVPALNLGGNWQDVPAFTFSDSARFITAPESGLQIAPERLQRVLTQAAAVDGTRGLIRPIVLNMLGSVLGRIADSALAELPTGNLLAGDLRSVVNHKERRMVARTVLPQMLTEADTKRPRSIGELSEIIKLESQVILGCLLDLELSGYVRQISRPTEIANRIWEISHDFVARLLGQILKTPFQTFWGRLGRVLYPLSLGVWGLAAIGLCLVTPWLGRMHSDQILRDRFSFFLQDTGNGYLAQEQRPSTFRDLSGAIPHLVNFGGIINLDLSNCTLLTNIDALKELKALRILILKKCTGLTTLDALKQLKALRTLDLSYCGRLKNLDGLNDLRALKTLILNNCTGLTNIEVLKNLKDLPTLDLSSCTGLTNVDALKELTALQALNLNNCTGLTDVDALKELKALQALYLGNCTKLTKLDALKELTALKTLYLNNCTGLTNVDILKKLTALQAVNLNNCTGLTDVDASKELTALQALYLGNCTKLTKLDALKELTALKTLYLSNCTGLTNVDVLKQLKSLSTLDLNNCTGLTNVDALKELTALQALYLGNCTKLTNLDALKEVTALKTLYLSNCTGLTNVDALNKLAALQTLYLNNCTGLTNIDALKELKDLQILDLSYCTGLTNIDALKDLKDLRGLKLIGCAGLTQEAVDQLRAALSQAQIDF